MRRQMKHSSIRWCVREVSARLLPHSVTQEARQCLQHVMGQNSHGDRKSDTFLRVKQMVHSLYFVRPIF